MLQHLLGLCLYPQVILCPIFRVIREMQIKITLRFHLTPFRMAKAKTKTKTKTNKQTKNKRQWMPMRNTPALQVGSQSHWESDWWFLRKLDSLISGYYPRNSEYTDHRTLKNKVWVLWFFWEGELNTGPKWRQTVEQRLKERSARDCPTCVSIPYTVTKSRH